MSLQKELVENSAQSVKVTNSKFEAVQKNVYNKAQCDSSSALYS